ncbi:hypothetical protein [Nakamurella endophytica]|uniref:Uncharacterized protein n=1 Tax=Nakamurella endophytica TaxID=1748367 RepID=A0A917SPC7_9ACTN|nr:hypothetical protein [Nakamurella endophytica]GGL89854.1 hypothetical protein GCM10011594_06890 [Nakamurella endophytica]
MQRIAGFMRTYWTRGTPGRPTPRSLAVFMQRMWLLALTFKLLGSSWDVSWHFKWLRDDFAPPHLLNTVGTGIAIGLVLAHTFTGYGAERTSLRIMQWGTGIFVVAGPIDVINHRINGLDLTAWSPSHLMLYLGTMIMVIGVIRNWYRSYPRDLRFGRLNQWTAGLVLLFAFLFEDFFFPTGQQEYGILEVGSWLRGAPYAEPSLLSFAATQLGRPVDDVAIQHFAMPIASWVYPVWVLVVCVAVLVAARLLVGVRWTATLVVALYVAYRCIIWPLLVVSTFPPSSLPLWVLPVGVAVDLVFLVPRLPAVARAVVGAVVVGAVGYGALLLSAVVTGTPTDLGHQDIAGWRADWAAGAYLWTPPVAWWSAWIAVPGLAVSWAVVEIVVARRAGRDTARPPALAVTYGSEPLRGSDKVLRGWPDGTVAPSGGRARPAPTGRPAGRPGPTPARRRERVKAGRR